MVDWIGSGHATPNPEFLSKKNYEHFKTQDSFEIISSKKKKKKPEMDSSIYRNKKITCFFLDSGVSSRDSAELELYQIAISGFSLFF